MLTDKSRLTHEARRVIAHQVASRKLSKGLEKLETQLSQQAEKVYDAYFTKSLIAKLDSLPRYCLPSRSVYVKMFFTHAEPNSDNRISREDVVMVFAQFSEPKYNFKSNAWAGASLFDPQDIVKLEPNTRLAKLVDKFKQISAQVSATQSQMIDIRNAVYKNLMGFTTVKKLLEGWPEVKPILEAELGYYGPGTKKEPFPTVPLSAVVDNAMGLLAPPVEIVDE